MPINQLFSKVPPFDLINEFLVYLGHNGIEDCREFSKFIFTDELIDKMSEILETLSNSYSFKKILYD